MSDPVFKLFVTVDLQNRKILHWKMNSSFKPSSSVGFYVDRSRSAGPWTQIAGPVMDDCFYVDNQQLNWNKDKNTFYRIRFKQGASHEWTLSTPCQAIGSWSDKDYAIAREIARKEALMNRLAGQTGVFMKRRNWGPLCTLCTDFDSREVVNISCPECLGTGITGGYWAPIPMGLWNASPMTNQRGVRETGTTQTNMNKNRCIAYPFVEKNDIWMDDHSNTRWIINDVAIAAERKSIPILYDLTMSLAPRSNIIYGPEMTAKATTPAVKTPSGTGTEYGWASGTSCEDKY